MMTGKYISIDFGSSKISAMAAEVQKDNQVKVLAVETKKSDDIKNGVIHQASGAGFKVNELIKLLHNSARIEMTNIVSVSINAKTMRCKSITISRFVGAPGVVTQRLLDEMYTEVSGKIVAGEVSLLDVFPVQYVVDGRNVDAPENTPGREISATYNVVYGHKKILEELDRSFDRTGGISYECRFIGAEALSTALLDDREMKDGCAIIDFGAETTSFSIFKDDVIQQLIVVPLGSKNITRDIAELGVAEQNAEKLKRVAGKALESLVDQPVFIEIPANSPDELPVRISTAFLATIIEARLDETMHPIFVELEKYKDVLKAGIVLCGGGSRLNGLIEYVQQKSSIYTRIGDFEGWLTENTSDEFHDIEYAQLLGTILLQADYRSEHPLVKPEVVKNDNTPKPKRKSIKDKLTKSLFNFFGDDDNKL
jgi:cell division protein FtsA